MDAVAGWAAEQGKGRVVVGITNTNLGAVAFFEHLGYGDTGTREHLPDGRQLVMMARKLEQ
jgi:ribosomal protein S18 acetylase RimI-like enzyme